MPSTKHKAHRPRRAKSPGRAEEVELATVYLELKSRVSPTWGRSVEPDAYITDLDGDILLARGDEDEIPVGKISAHSVHLDEADEDGVSWFDVLDARSGDTAMYVDLIDSEGSGYSEWIESAFEPFGSGLLILDRIRIEPEHRGHGYGLYAAQLMITGFASGGIVGCVPAPYELLKDAPPLHSESMILQVTASGAFRAGGLPKPSCASIGHSLGLSKCPGRTFSPYR